MEKIKELTLERMINYAEVELGAIDGIDIEKIWSTLNEKNEYEAMCDLMSRIYESGKYIGWSEGYRYRCMEVEEE